MKSVKWFLSYLLVASMGLGLAFVASVKFMAPAHSENAPSNGDLPPEFLKEVETTAVPAPDKKNVTDKSGATAGNEVKATPTPVAAPAPSATPPPAAAQVPIPPPPMEAVGDGATANSKPSSSYTFKETFTYDPSGRRDPFAPFKIMQNISMEPAKAAKSLEPLQRYDIEKIKVIGILWDVRKPRAMVRDPDGIVHTIVKDTKIGRNEGFVAAIREGEIVVIENRLENGKVVSVPSIMELKK